MPQHTTASHYPGRLHLSRYPLLLRFTVKARQLHARDEFTGQQPPTPQRYKTSMEFGELEQKWCAASESIRLPVGRRVGTFPVPDRCVQWNRKRRVPRSASQRRPLATWFHEKPRRVAAHDRRTHRADAPVSHGAVSPATLELTYRQLRWDFLYLVSQPAQQGAPSSHLAEFGPSHWRYPRCLSTVARR